MGLLKRLFGRGAGQVERNESAEPVQSASTVAPREEERLVEVPAYVPVSPAAHRTAVVAAAVSSAVHPTESLTLKRLSMANAEYQRVAAIASAIAAGDRPQSAFTVRHIYKKDTQSNEKLLEDERLMEGIDYAA